MSLDWEPATMTIKQLSIFLENSPGRLLQITTALGNEGINLKALNLSGSSDFGILRLICSDLHKARNIAMKNQWPARVDEVLAVRVPDSPGSLANILKPLNENCIDVQYMYAFTRFSTSEALIIFGFKEIDKAIEVLRGCGAALIDADDFKSLESQE
jgi:hypothetical protein